MTIITIEELISNLDEFLERVQLGQKFLISENGEIKCLLVPIDDDERENDDRKL